MVFSRLGLYTMSQDLSIITLVQWTEARKNTFIESLEHSATAFLLETPVGLKNS